MESSVCLQVKREISPCAGCLSSDRNLVPLKDKAFFIYLLGPDWDAMVSEQVFLCWECTSQFKKICRFQHQIKKAQMILQQTQNGVDINYSLSNLEKTILCPLDISPDEQKEPENMFMDVISNIKPITNIKEEFNFDYDTDGHFDNSYDVEDIKTEDVVVKQEKKIDLNIDCGAAMRVNRYTKRAKVTKNLTIDWDNFLIHFEDSVISEEEINALGIVVDSRLKRDKLGVKACKQCKKKFGNKLDARRHKTFVHVLTEDKMTAYLEEECILLERQSGFRKSHITVTALLDSEGALNCLECKETCQDKDGLRSHWTKHNKVMRCKFCQEAVGIPSTLGIPTALKMHLQRHSLCYTCKECTGFHKTFSSYGDFSYHYKTLHLNYFCDFCQKRKKSKKSLEKHMRSVHISPTCIECNKTFKRYQHLQLHIDSFHPELSTQKRPDLSYCVECDKQYGSADLYKKHLRSTKAHNPAVSRKKIVPCPDCTRVFSRVTYMRNHHLQVHKKQSRHYCNLCDKMMFSAWSLKTHIAGVHMKLRGPKDKICDLCGRGFSSNAVLAKHIRTHTGERPYQCTHCPAAFTQRTPLKSHLRTQHKVF